MRNKIISFIASNSLIICGILLILISFIGFRNSYLDKKITKRNKIVMVNVIDCYQSGKNSYFLEFKFMNKTFTKRAKKSYCKEISGKNKIELLTNKNKDRFLFLDEYDTKNDLLFSLILGFFALLIIYKGF